MKTMEQATNKRTKQGEKRVKTMIQSAETEQKKRKPSDNESDLNAQEYKSRKKKSKIQVSEEQTAGRNASTRYQYCWL